MDKKQLEQKLSEVAEWVYPSVSQDNAYERVIPWGGKEYKQQYTPKPDMGPRVIRIKPTANLKPCEWCGRIVDQKISVSKKTTKERPQPHWHWNCDTCQKGYDPTTGEFTSRARQPYKRRDINTK